MKAKLIKTEKGYHLDTGSFDGIHLACYPHDVTKQRLSLKNCQAIELGYDLDKLADNEVKGVPKGDERAQRYYGFINGFQKALELMGDKKFSEGDVRKAIDIARNGSMQEQHNGYGRPTELRFVLDNTSSDEIIQSLQQTEWDVKVEMEKVPVKMPGIMVFTKAPKLDADGCLILKRI